jgi:hypothetical protein
MANDSGARPPLQVVPSEGTPEPPQNQRIELANHQRLMDVIKAQLGPRSAHLAGQQAQTMKTITEIKDEENREPRYSSHLFYWPFLALLALCEVPVNRFSFELFFRESPTIAMVVAGLVGIVLMGLAHGVGTILRHWGYNWRRGSRVVSVVWLLVFVGMIAGLVWGVSVFRQGYLTFVQQPDPTFAQMLENQQFGQAAITALGLELKAEGWIFLILNTAIVVVGVSAAYFCHDPHPDYEKVDRERRKLTKAIGALETKRGKAEAREKERHARVMRRLGAVT